MRKLMEVFVADNGLIVKKQSLVYHLFSTSTKEESESITIGNEKDAFIFLANFFAHKLKIDRKKKITMTTFDETIEFRLMLQEEESEYKANILKKGLLEIAALSKEDSDKSKDIAKKVLSEIGINTSNDCMRCTTGGLQDGPCCPQDN